jgi:hypothetical protein
MLFREIISVYTKPQIENSKLLTVKTGGTYSYQWALKGSFNSGGGRAGRECISDYENRKDK